MRLGVRRLRQNLFCDPAGNHHVLAKRGAGRSGFSRQDLRHGLDVGGVQFVELADVFQDMVELALEGRNLGFGKLKVGQVGYTQNVFAGNLHVLPGRLFSAENPCAILAHAPSDWFDESESGREKTRMKTTAVEAYRQRSGLLRPT